MRAKLLTFIAFIICNMSLSTMLKTIYSAFLKFIPRPHLLFSILDRNWGWDVVATPLPACSSQIAEKLCNKYERKVYDVLNLTLAQLY